MTNIVIVSAARTAVGAFNGGLASMRAHELGAIVLEEVVRRAGLDKSEIEETILGQVLTAGQGQNPARQAHLRAGMPEAASAWGLNQVCGSGLRAVALGAQQIMTGCSRIVLAGGQENMSLSPHVANLRVGQRMGDMKFVDSMIVDGLWDAFNDYHMGRTAENLATKFSISRREQDEVAAASHHKASTARQAGRFKEEIVPVSVKNRKETVVVDIDEHIRPDATTETLKSLRPAFLGDGTVTAGNASGINDGAAAVLMMSEEDAMRRNLTPLARVVSFATAGVDPAIMGIGPVPASRKALAIAGWNAADLDLIEANEAFAAQSCAVLREMEWNPEKVNVNGGAIAIGHPIGASGARILNTLLFEMRRRSARKALATLCIGGGMGVAMCLEGA